MTNKPDWFDKTFPTTPDSCVGYIPPELKEYLLLSKEGVKLYKIKSLLEDNSDLLCDGDSYTANNFALELHSILEEGE